MIPAEQIRDILAQLASDPAGAAIAAQRLLIDWPDLPVARRVAALVARTLNRETEAERYELESIALSLATPALLQAQHALTEGCQEDAEKLVRAHLRADPEDPAAALILGQIAQDCGAKREAENLYRRAFLLAPGYAEARLALAKLQRDGGDYRGSFATLDALLARDAAHLPALSLKAAMEVQQREFDAADATFTLIHERHPQDARGWMNHAFMLKTVGRQIDAVGAYRKAIALDPGQAQAWWGLANLKTVKFTADDAAAMRALIDADGLAPDERIHLCYALGKAFDDLHDPASAFAAYAEGAKLRLDMVPYDPARVQNNVASVGRVFTPQFLSARCGWGSPTPDPIFIVSLPRSGSTLVEQILASHPMIEGTEELHDIERIAQELAPGQGAAGYLDVIGDLSRSRLEELGDAYIAATQRVRQTNRPFFTDKMPSNWVFAGLIHLMLPNAKIVDVRRHPLGCGFANFSQHFNWGINFSYDLAHIGGFYRAYMRQMAHFDRVLPGRIHHVIYEKLVEDTEGEVRRLLDYLELPFDPACLSFFENKRAVHTPSSEQVRSPINRDGMERWTRYEPWLGPLKDALGSVLDTYPNVPPDLMEP